MNPPSQRGSPFSYKVPNSDDALAFRAPEPSATSTSPTATPARSGMIASAMWPTHDHHAAVEDGAFHAEDAVGDPATEHCGEVNQAAVGADEARCGGLGKLEAAFGDRVIEVVGKDREHPVKREPLPQLHAEEIDKADRVPEQRASGRLFVRLSHCCHVGQLYHARARGARPFGGIAGRSSDAATSSCQTGRHGFHGAVQRAAQTP